MKKVITVILDGYGYREEIHGNAIKQANTPVFDELWEKYPHSLLEASGEAVGLPEGQFGNSEIGHMTIGAGKLLISKVNVINDAINNDEVSSNQEFRSIIDHVKNNQSTFHMMGLVSDGGVHSDLNYIKKLVRLVKDEGITKLYFHAITDGRDTKRDVALNYINDLKTYLDDTEIGKIATVCGRFYAMDRDKKYDRTKKYYDMVVNGEAIKFNDVNKAIKACYKKEVFDEYLPPFILDENGLIKDGDGILWVNFRPDRAIQILSALTYPDFKGFKTKKFENIKLVSMFPVAEDIVYTNMFEDMSKSDNSIGRYFSALGLTQARIAESEKYAHVTYYFDGGLDEKLNGADYFLFPSPQVTNYSDTPKMKAEEIKNKVIECLEGDYDFILVNFCNPDMIGHTGDMKATIEAIEYIDKCLGELFEAVKNNFYTMFLLADHGNADYMLDDQDNIIKTHSTSPVPFIVTDEKVKVKNGALPNVAPTILKYMDIALPKEMKETKNLFKD